MDLFGEASQVAVESLDIAMFEGQILALLGHNGAGKSTTINMIFVQNGGLRHFFLSFGRVFILRFTTQTLAQGQIVTDGESLW